MAILLPALYNFLFLGLTVNYNNYYKTKYAIYGNLRGKSTLEQSEQYSSQYRVIQSAKDIRELHNIDSRLCLKLRTSLYIDDLSRLITGSSIRSDSDIEIQIFIRHQKTIERIPEDVRIHNELLSKIKNSSSTHFVKRIINGAILQANVVFHCHSIEHKEKVLKVILSHFQESGTFDKTFIEKFQDAKKEFGSDFPKYRIENIYCRGCKTLYGYTLQNILTTAEKLQETLKDNNGEPIAMEIEDLSTVYDIPAYRENKEILEKLNEIHEMHEDIRIAGADFADWQMIIPNDLDENERELINKFKEEIFNAEMVFIRVINRLNTSTSLNQFDEIYEVYGDIGNYNHFRKKFQELEKKIKID